MTEYYVIPTIGTFKVTITQTFDRNNQLLYYSLNIGGNSDKCVYITIPAENLPNKKELSLSWAEVIDKSCTTDSQIIKGSKTVEMLNLAFTIAKEIAPYAEYVKLSDMSYFLCNTPSGKIKVSLPPYHIAFYDMTWYEEKFKAVLVNVSDYATYRECIKNMYKEGFMPRDFFFGNDKIREMLYPLYTKSKTWKQFFKLIEESYPNEKCALMYPWINNAMNIIFEDKNLYAGHNWKIYLDKVPRIHYYQLKGSDSLKGDKYTNEYSIQYSNYRDVNLNTTMNWNIDTFIKNNKKRNTSKYSAKKYKYNKTKKNNIIF